MRHLLFLFLAAATSIPGHAVINGKVVGADEFPARSTIIIVRNGAPICSGTLVAPDLALTAAHCVHDEDRNLVPWNQFQIYFGNVVQHHWNDDLTRSVTDLRANPGYEDKKDPRLHDLSLLKFSGTVPPGFSPVAILTDVNLLRIGTPLLLAGYGNIMLETDKNEPHNRTLRSFDERIMEPDSKPTGAILTYDSDELMKKFKVHLRKIAGHPELRPYGGMAGGDSGAPAYLVNQGIPYVAGVASGYTRDNHPIYEDVPAHATWVEQTAKDMGSALVSASLNQ